jgi:WhiB family transcriptional regulator, redox-sensing transcriptional regulator
VADAGDRAAAVTARQPCVRIPVSPAPPVAGWRDRAACRGTELSVFFPGRGESAEPARQVCAGCPVRQPCLDYAISHAITSGIWGGLAERDRRALRSRHRVAVRRERDAAIAAAAVAGHSKAAIGRAFGLAGTSVSRALSRTADWRGQS